MVRDFYLKYKRNHRRISGGVEKHVVQVNIFRRLLWLLSGVAITKEALTVSRWEMIFLDLRSGNEDGEGSRLEIYLEGRNNPTEITHISLNQGLGNGKSRKTLNVFQHLGGFYYQ